MVGALGPTGDRGQKGTAGEDGSPGEKGEKGWRGVDGELGPEGPKGAQVRPITCTQEFGNFQKSDFKFVNLNFTNSRFFFHSCACGL